MGHLNYLQEVEIEKMTEDVVYYPNALGPKGSEWSYLIPLASVMAGCGPVVYWIMVLAAYLLCGTFLCV